jgi:hypothetical protein
LAGVIDPNRLKYIILTNETIETSRYDYEQARLRRAQSIRRVSDIIIPMIFGWPAVITSILFMSIGIARMRWEFVLVGALSASPFLLYLFLTPRFQWVALPVAALLFGASRSVARGHSRAALAMVVPFVGLAVFVAWGVVNQWTR